LGRPRLAALSGGPAAARSGPTSAWSPVVASGGMEKLAVETRVKAALAMLLARDAFLLEQCVGERAVVAKLASYLAPLFRDYDVDVEYNRHGLNPKDPKKLPIPPECPEKKTEIVYPDLIVHRRGSERADNLLVMEVKCASNNAARDCDRAKIKAMRREFGYAFGLFIVLPDGPRATDENAVEEWFEGAPDW
jgi:hypothetical protein